MNKPLATLSFLLWFFCSGALAEQVDITQYLTAMIRCNAEEYKPGQGDFDIDRFNAAWAACLSTREALLNVLPEQVHPEWEAKFELMRTSMIDRFQPQPSQKGYGLNPEQPVKIGGIEKGAERTYAYFSRLRTPKGQPIRVRRIGSCCSFETPNARIGTHAPLDKYELTSEGVGDKTIVYINIYDEDTVQAIKGFVLNDVVSDTDKE